MTEVAAREGQLAELRAQLADCRAQLERAHGVRAPGEGEMERLRARGAALARELDAFRERRLVRLRDRVAAGGDVLVDLPPGFQQLQDDSVLFGEVAGFDLRFSRSLPTVGVLEYPLRPRRPGLEAVMLAVSCEESSGGEFRAALLSPERRLVARGSFLLARVLEGVPSRVAFPPIPDSDREALRLEVSVEGSSVPVRLLEWQRRRWGGLREPERRAFCGFVFGGAGSQQ
jgi:hypothetical protein